MPNPSRVDKGEGQRFVRNFDVLNGLSTVATPNLGPGSIRRRSQALGERLSSRDAHLGKDEFSKLVVDDLQRRADVLPAGIPNDAHAWPREEFEVNPVCPSI